MAPSAIRPVGEQPRCGSRTEGEAALAGQIARSPEREQRNADENDAAPEVLWISDQPKWLPGAREAPKKKSGTL